MDITFYLFHNQIHDLIRNVNLFYYRLSLQQRHDLLVLHRNGKCLFLITVCRQCHHASELSVHLHADFHG